MTVVHDLQLAEDLFPDGRLRVNQHDLYEVVRDSCAGLVKMATKRTFLAMIVPVGRCSTFFTLPPLPWPSSWRSLRSSFRRSWYLCSELSSRLASVVERVVWYVLRWADAEPVGGAEFGPFTVKRLLSGSTVAALVETLGAASFMGGGRFFPPPAGTGATRMGSGWGSGGGWETSSWRALKLRFLRTRPAAGVTVAMIRSLLPGAPGGVSGGGEEEAGAQGEAEDAGDDGPEERGGES